MDLKEIMTSPVATIAPETSLAHAAKTMLASDIGFLPVSNGQTIVGIISDRDITIRAVAKGMDPERTAVKDVMTMDVFTCPASSDVTDACRLMEEKQVRRLVVVDATGSPVGIVSLGDIAVKEGKDSRTGDTLEEISEGVKTH